MTIDVERLRQLHRSYQPVPPYGELYCQGCYLEWPCATSELLDAYEERDRLRAALAEQGFLQNTTTGKVWHAHDCPASFDFAQCNYRCRVARTALEGRE